MDDFERKLYKAIMARTNKPHLSRKKFEKHKRHVLRQLSISSTFRKEFYGEEPKVVKGLIEKPKNLTPFYVPPKVN